MKILIVDDDAESRMLLRLVLEQRGAGIIEAVHGSEGLEKARSDRPDLIISDILMPEMDGFEFLWHVKGDPALADIPFVIHSSTYVKQQDLELATALGADRFLIKPLEPGELWKNIQDVIDITGREGANRIKTSHITGEADFIRKYGRVIATKLEEKIRVLEQEIARRKAAETDRDRLFNYSMDMLGIAGFDGFLKEINPAWSKTLGWTREELLAKPYVNFVHPDDRAATLNVMRRLVKGENAFNIETRARCKDGTYRWLNTNAYALTSEKLIFGVLRDITERRKFEERLQHSERNLIEAQRIAHIGSHEYDVKHNRLSWSDEVINIFGMRPGEFTGRSEEFYQRVHPDDREAVRKAITDSIRRGGGEFFHRIIRPDGTVRVVRQKFQVLRDGRKGGRRHVGITQDVTEQFEAERERRTNEQRLEALLKLNQLAASASEQQIADFALDVIVKQTDSEAGYLHVFDEDGKTASLVSWSGAATKECSARADRHLSVDRAGVWAESVRLRKPVIHNDYPALAGRKGHPESHFPVRRHVTVPVFDGDRIVAVVGMGNKRDPYTESDIRHIYVYANDFWSIMARKRAEQALRESEQKFRDFAEKSQAGIYFIQHGALRYVNETFAEIFGYQVGEILGKIGIEDLIAPEDQTRVLESIRQRISGEVRRANYTFQGRKKDGTRIVCEVYSTRTMINGEPAAIGTIMDVTERVRSEQKIRHLSQAVEQSPASIVITDASGSIEYVNSRFSEITGYSFAEAVGQNPRILKSGDTPSEQYKTLWNTIRSGGEWKGEFLNRKKNGELFWESATISPLTDPEGRITHFIAVKEDISERKQLEERLKEYAAHLEEMVAARTRDFEDANTRLLKLNEELTLKSREVEEASLLTEAASRAKSEFLANMSHELRTPLNAVIGMVHLSLQTDLTPKQRDYLGKIEASSQALLAVISDILDFSKIEAGKMELRKERFTLDDVLHTVATIISLKAQEKGLEFLIDKGPDVPWILEGDHVRLGQVLINLCSNAVKFTDAGRVVIAIGSETRDIEAVRLRFSVRDTGIGMRPADMDRLFKPFSQADASLTRKHGGTGLGLTICKRLVEMMGGLLSVESEPGKGSVFSFSVPFGMVTGVQRTFEIASELRGMRVLVVDGADISRDILRKLLETLGFDAVPVSTLDAGLKEIEKDMLEQRPPGLALMDWKPGGYDLVEAVRGVRASSQADRSLKIIVVTSVSREAAANIAEEAGADGLLIKPVTASSLFNEIMSAFGRGAVEEARLAGKRLEERTAPGGPVGARILVAEDNEINQQVARELLELAGYSVVVAGNGQQAVELVRAYPFDAVLMDIQMPYMDGYDAARAIRKLPGTETLPVIAMTAHATAQDREACLRAGMNDYITKPVEPEKLYEVLEKWIAEQKRREPTPEAVAAAGERRTTAGSLPPLPGIAVENALARLGGDAAIYRRMLQLFAEGRGNVLAEIDAALAAGDRMRAAAAVHAIRGAAGNVGAETLMRIAGDIETALRRTDRDPPGDLLSLFKQEFSIVKEGIQNALRETDEETAGAGRALPDRVRTERLIEQLEDLLEKDLPRALEAFRELERILRGEVFMSVVTELRKRLDRFDTEGAKEKLRDIRGMLNR